MEQNLYDLIIIGGGPGGLTAALYGARAGLKTLVLEKLSAGGQMALTEQVDNYPGFPQGVDGFTLGEQMAQQAQRFGAQLRYGEVTALDLKASPKVITTRKETLFAKTVIVATGADPRPLGVAREQELTGKGVAYCAACDGMAYRGKTVAVVGGGNSAVADALLLSRVARKVYLIHRRDQLRATPVYLESLKKAENLEFLWDTAVTALEGQTQLSGLTLKNLKTGEGSHLACDGLFVSVGRKPNTALVEGQLELDTAGYILAGESTKTSVPGVFAVGDVRTKHLRQVATAVADGAMAVEEAAAAQ